MTQSAPPTGTPPAQSKSSSNTAIILIVVAVVLFVGVAIVGVLAALGIYGVRKYVSDAKAVEGRQAVVQIAAGAVACSQQTLGGSVAPGAAPGGAPGLPPTTTPVPASLSAVSGKKYQSAPAEWSGSGWDCIGFSMPNPQYFQYEWQRTSPTDGVAKAQADLDGDGVAELSFELPVSCTDAGGQVDCQADPMPIERFE